MQVELHPDGEYLPDATVLEMLGRTELSGLSVHFQHPMAFGDGRLAIGTVIYPDREKTPQAPVMLCQVDLADGAIRVRDFTGYAVAQEPTPSHGRWLPLPFQDDVVYLRSTSQAFLVPSGPNSVPCRIDIASANLQLDGDRERFRAMLPSRTTHPSFQGSQAAIPLSTGGEAEYLGLFTLNRQKLTGSWSNFHGEDGPRPKPGLIAKLFGTPRGADGVAPVAPLKLHPDDFPKLRTVDPLQPLINDALLRDDKILIYTKGHSESPKYGYDCSDIAEINAEGRVTAKPFANDYRDVDDEKKRGLSGRFTSSGRYCLLNSIYQSTDPWGGRQKLFDLENGTLNDIKLPKGYSRFQICDHGGDWFWAKPSDGRAPQRFVRMKII